MNHELQQIVLGNLGCLEFTADLVRRVEHIEGPLCEAGVAFGGQLINMALTSQKTIYAFDSFEGISQHSDEDEEFTEAHGKGSGDQRETNGVTSVPLSTCVKNINRFEIPLERFIFNKGWFIDTLPELTDEKFSLIRLDCDVYGAYKTCLEELYPRLQPGGVLIIDDWNLSGCKQALEEYFGVKRMGEFIVDDRLGNAYLIK